MYDFVDAAVHVLDNIWEAPLQKSIAFVCDDNIYEANSVDDSESITRSCKCPVGRPVTAGIPLDLFIRETLRRSRTSCSTLQAALLFCKRAGGEVIRQRAQKEGVVLSAEQLNKLPGSTNTFASLQSVNATSPSDYILCSRRIFLASVMVSSKFLQDRTFSNRAWSKISGLNVRELCVVERRLLMAVEFDLNVCEQDWMTWTTFLKGQGQWKTRCDHKKSLLCAAISSTTEDVPTLRKLMERTTSLQVGEVFDADLALPSGDEKAFFETERSCRLSCSPLSILSIATTGKPTSTHDETETATSTPTMSTSQSLCSTAGESTPTTAKMTHSSTATDSRKVDSSLLSTALHNHMLSVDGQNSNLDGMSLPFPLRKGFTTRSISSF